MSDPRARIDLGEAFGFVLKQPGWPAKLLLPGILGFIPVLGPVALLGWQRRIVAGLREGQAGLPDMDVSEDIVGGLAPTVAILNVAGLMFLGALLGFAGFILVRVGDAIGNRTVADLLDALALLAGLAGFGLSALIGLATFVVMPELLRRGHKGEMFPAASPKASLAAAREHASLLIIAGLGCFVANSIGAMGSALCLVGMALTAPWATATMAHIVVQWSRVLESQPPPKQVEGPPPGAIAWTGNR